MMGSVIPGGSGWQLERPLSLSGAQGRCQAGSADVGVHHGEVVTEAMRVDTVPGRTSPGGSRSRGAVVCAPAPQALGFQP